MVLASAGCVSWLCAYSLACCCSSKLLYSGYISDSSPTACTGAFGVCRCTTQQFGRCVCGWLQKQAFSSMPKHMLWCQAPAALSLKHSHSGWTIGWHHPMPSSFPAGGLGSGPLLIWTTVLKAMLRCRHAGSMQVCAWYSNCCALLLAASSMKALKASVVSARSVWSGAVFSVCCCSDLSRFDSDSGGGVCCL